MKAKKIQLDKLTNRLRSYKLQAGLGFTLIEAVVSVGVFAFAVTSIMGVYISVQRVNRESRALQALQQNGRFISEDITKIIRNGNIDYSCYPGGVPQPQTSNLCMLDQNDQRVMIYLSGTKLLISRGGSVSDLTTQDVRILNFRVFITPSTDPFASGASVNFQPTVTVFMNLESVIAGIGQSRIPYQFTATAKKYPVLQ